MNKIIICILLLFLILYQSCSLNVAGGSGTDVPDAVVIGLVVDTLGMPVANSQVTLIPVDYNPVVDGQIPETMKDVTSNLGMYSLDVPVFGNYNIEVYNNVNNTKALVRNISAFKDTAFATIGTLQNPGTIKIFIPDTVDINNGYLYIKGTSLLKPLSEAVVEDSVYYSITFDSVPAGMIPPIIYINKESIVDTVTLADSVCVIPNDTVISEAFVSWKQFTKDNSELSGNCINDICVTASGTIWIATDSNGVVSYIDNNWTQYNTDNSQLPSNKVNRIATDTKGKLWFSTIMGAASFDGNQWVVYDSVNDGLPSNYVTNIEEDYKGDYWFSTFGGGVAKFNGKDWVVYDTSTSLLFVSNNINHFTIDNVNNYEIWFGTDKGLLIYDTTEFTYYTLTDPSNGSQITFMNCIAIGNNGVRWFTYENGVAKCVGPDAENSTWDYFGPIHSQVLNTKFINVYIDEESNAWFSSEKGLTKYNGSTWLDHRGEKYQMLNDKEITSFAIDKAGVKWICTKNNGVIVFSKKRI